MRHDRPSIFGIDSAEGWLEKAQRELSRFEAATSREEATDHIINFGIAMAHVAEWEWETHVKSHPRWSHVGGLNAFKALVTKQQPALGYMETLCQSSKHPELNRHEPSFQDATAMPVTVLAPLSTHPMAPDDQITPYAVEIKHQVRVGTIPVNLSDAAGAAVKFWRNFDADTSPIS